MNAHSDGYKCLTEITLYEGDFMVTHILFDFDGTLLDTNELIVEALNASALKFRGKEIGPKELDGILGKPLAVQMKELDEEHWEEMDAYYRSYYRERRDAYTKEFNGIRDMLDELKALGLTMGIVSNKGTAGIAHGLTIFDMKKYFNSAISADDVENKKPDPEGIFKALKELDGLPEKTLFIGDSGHDIECGKNAGTRTILVGWTILDRNRLMKTCPDHVVETPAEIVDIVRGLLK